MGLGMPHSEKASAVAERRDEEYEDRPHAQRDVGGIRTSGVGRGMENEGGRDRASKRGKAVAGSFPFAFPSAFLLGGGRLKRGRGRVLWFAGGGGGRHGRQRPLRLLKRENRKCSVSTTGL